MHVVCGLYAAVVGKTLSVPTLRPDSVPAAAWTSGALGMTPAVPLPPEALPLDAIDEKLAKAGLEVFPVGDLLGLACAALARSGCRRARVALCARLVMDVLLLREALNAAEKLSTLEVQDTVAPDRAGSRPHEPVSAAEGGAWAVVAAKLDAGWAAGTVAHGVLRHPAAAEAAVGAALGHLVAYPGVGARAALGQGASTARQLTPGRVAALAALAALAVHHCARHLLAALPGLTPCAGAKVGAALGDTEAAMARRALGALACHARATLTPALALACSRALGGLGDHRAAVGICAGWLFPELPPDAPSGEALLPPSAWDGWDSLSGATSAQASVTGDAFADHAGRMLAKMAKAALRAGPWLAQPGAGGVGADACVVSGGDDWPAAAAAVAALVEAWPTEVRLGALPGPALAPWSARVVHWRWRLACLVTLVPPSVAHAPETLARVVDVRAAAGRALLALADADGVPIGKGDWNGLADWLAWLQLMQRVWLCHHVWERCTRLR